MVVGARHVEAVRLREGLRVAVRGTDPTGDDGAGLDPLSAELHVLRRDPHRGLHGRVEAQQLLHRRLEQRGLRPQPVELVAMAQERQQAVADEVRRCLVPGDQQQVAVREELLVRERVAILLRLDHRGEQVVARIAPALGDDLAQVAEDALEGRLEALARASEGEAGGVHQIRRPGLEALVVLGGHSEELRDDDGG